MSESVQNVILFPVRNSVVQLLQHPELTELSLCKASDSICIGHKKKYICLYSYLLKLLLPAFPHCKHTYICTDGFSLSDSLHNATKKKLKTHNLSNSLQLHKCVATDSAVCVFS